MPANPRRGRCNPMRANVKARQVLVAALVVAAGFGLQGRGLAGLAAGGGKKPENDCLVALRVDETATGALSSPIKCADCDANCDQDGQTQSNKACTFKVALCVNQTSVLGCTGTALKTAVGRVRGADVKKLTAPSDLSGPPICGDPTLVTVRVKGKKMLHAGKATVTLRGVSSAKGKQRRIDADRVVLECDPQPAPTCPTTTTTLPATCDCCALHPSLLKFTTTTGTGNCGKLQDAQGNKLEDLTCSGLYFGGKGVAVPLPGSVPDMGLAFTKITACNAATGEVTVTGSSAAETGSIRTCTSGGGHCAISTCETTTGVCTSPAG